MKPCRCGHTEPMHQHYRTGTDCSVCNCPRWQPSWLARIRGLIRMTYR